MNNSETHSKSGFLRRFFGRSTPAGDLSSRNESGEIIMPSPSTEDGPAKRLPKAKTVLVVAADDAATRRWRRELENAGYGIETVADGIQGLDILYNFAFDAVLIDWAAPKIVGGDMLREIRNHDELKTLFVGVFARDKDGKAEQEMAALDAGASRVFQRSSVKGDEILTALKTALCSHARIQVQPRCKTAGLRPHAGPMDMPAMLSMRQLRPPCPARRIPRVLERDSGPCVSRRIFSLPVRSRPASRR